MVRIHRRVSVTTAKDGRSAHEDVASKSAAVRILMMWQLTIDAWAFMGEDVAQRRLSRDVIRVRKQACGRPQDLADIDALGKMDSD